MNICLMYFGSEELTGIRVHLDVSCQSPKRASQSEEPLWQRYRKQLKWGILFLVLLRSNTEAVWSDGCRRHRTFWTCPYCTSGVVACHSSLTRTAWRGRLLRVLAGDENTVLSTKFLWAWNFIVRLKAIKSDIRSESCGGMFGAKGGKDAENLGIELMPSKCRTRIIDTDTDTF